VAALEAAQQVDPVAKSIGAANTLVRQPDSTLKAYNTDWSAAIDAVEEGFGGDSLLIEKALLLCSACRPLNNAVNLRGTHHAGTIHSGRIAEVFVSLY